MSHKEEGRLVYLPNGLEVNPGLLAELHPTWFPPNRHVTQLFAADFKEWGLRLADVRRLQEWCRGMMREYPGTTKEYCLAVCFVGTARKNSLEPVALLEIFETVEGASQALIDKTVTLPKTWGTRAIA